MAEDKSTGVAKPRASTPTAKEPEQNQTVSSDSSKFETPEIIILITIAVLNDLLALAADFSLAIPVLGEVLVLIAEFVDLLVWGIILLWFGLKVGLFGIAGFAQMIGGAAEFIGIPGRTVAAVIGIIAVNNPTIAKVASEVTNPEGAVVSEATGGKITPEA